jgi:hypothetical protein
MGWPGNNFPPSISFENPIDRGRRDTSPKEFLKGLVQPTSHQNGAHACLFPEAFQKFHFLVRGHEGAVATPARFFREGGGSMLDEVDLGYADSGGMPSDHLGDFNRIHVLLSAKPHAEIAPEYISGPFLSAKSIEFPKAPAGDRAGFAHAGPPMGPV